MIVDEKGLGERGDCLDEEKDWMDLLDQAPFICETEIIL